MCKAVFLCAATALLNWLLRLAGAQNRGGGSFAAPSGAAALRAKSSAISICVI